MLTKKRQKNALKFYCETCDFGCCKSSDFNRHIFTRKHQMLTNVDNMLTDYPAKNAEKRQKTPPSFTCECGKVYAHRQSLSLHKKKCDFKINSSDILTDDNVQHLSEDKSLILSLLNQNNQLQNQIIDLCKEKVTTSINTCNINSNNKTFNLNVFLNEECKDAMNIMDFVDSLKVQLSDLEHVGRIGFVEGISTLIVKNLKALDIHKRPVHCSDTKREILYVKDEDKWERVNQEKKKLKKAIKHIAHKNCGMLPEFKAKYPDCIFSESKKSDEYNKIIIESLGGMGNEDDDNENKIIKKIAKEVTIFKSN
jgi:hypothetical protein